MKEKLTSDLKKYEAEIVSINKRLADLDEQRKNIEEQRLGIITHGRRIEGIVAYIRASLADDKPAESAESIVEEKTEEGAKQ